MNQQQQRQQSDQCRQEVPIQSCQFPYRNVQNQQEIGGTDGKSVQTESKRRVQTMVGVPGMLGGTGNMQMIGGFGSQANLMQGFGNLAMGQFPYGYGNTTQNTAPKATINKYEQQISEKELDISKIIYYLEKLKKHIERIKTESIDMNEYEQLKLKFKRLQFDFQEIEIKQYQQVERIKKLTDQRDQDEAKIQNLRQSIIETEKLKKESNDSLEQFRDENYKLKLQIQSLSVQEFKTIPNPSIPDDLMKQLDKLRNENTELTQQKKQLQSSNEDNGKQLANLKCEITKLQYNLEEEQKNYRNKLKEIENQKQKIIQAGQEIKAKDDKINSLQVQNQNKLLNIQELEYKISNLKDQLQMQQQNQQKQNLLMNKLKNLLTQQNQIVDQKQSQSLLEEINQQNQKLEEQRLKQQAAEQKQIQDQIQRKSKLINIEKQSKEKQRNERNQKAQNIFKKMVESLGQLEVCFLVDCTGSMDSYKEQTMLSINGSMKVIKDQTGRDLKWSTVCYQDYVELDKLPNKQYQQLDFTTSSEELEEYLKGIKCDGGDDTAEDIRGGIIQMCQKISWDTPFRLAILICDAPSHGLKYNGGCGDKHPNDDIKDAILMLINKKITLMGINFTNQTQKMYSYISEIFQEKQRIDQFHLANMEGLKKEDIWQNLIQLILRASKSLTETNKSETKTQSSKTKALPTQDGAIQALCKAGNFFDFEKQGNVSCLDIEFKVIRVDIKEDSFNSKLEDIHLIKVPEDYEVNNEGNWDCIRTEKPFAFGMMKQVYLMKKKNATQELYVIKTPLGGKTYSTLNDAITECRSHLVCQKLMKKFIKEVNDACEEAENNGQQVKRYPQIVYSDFLILEENPKSFWIAERFFQGEFIKYNNNYGYIRDENDQLNQLAQAFSYYTFHVSNFNYMVNDVQGVNVYFTDPAINTIQGDFDQTDMGEHGQAMFIVNFRVKKIICKKILELIQIYPD